MRLTTSPEPIPAWRCAGNRKRWRWSLWNNGKEKKNENGEVSGVEVRRFTLYTVVTVRPIVDRPAILSWAKTDRLPRSTQLDGYFRACSTSLSLFFVLRRPTQRVLSTLCKYDISIDSFRPTESVVSRSLKKYRDTIIDNEIPGKLRGEGTNGTRRVRKVW